MAGERRHWVINLGKNGGLENFNASVPLGSTRGVWGTNMGSADARTCRFASLASVGDVIWFLGQGEKGDGWNKPVIAVGKLGSMPRERELGPLVAIDRTDQEIGWTGPMAGSWTHTYDVEKIKRLPANQIKFRISNIRTVRSNSSPSAQHINFEAEFKKAMRPCRDMRIAFRNRQKIRHVIDDEVWIGTYIAATNKIMHDGIEYKSISGFAKAHNLESDQCNNKSGNANGWTDCECKTSKGGWIKCNEL